MQSGASLGSFYSAAPAPGDVAHDAARTASCVLITGAASGLGLATAQRLVHEGIAVIGIDRYADTLDQLALQMGHRFRPLVCDVTDPQSVHEAATAAAVMQPSGIDAIVHFAGLHSAGALMDIDESEFADVLNVNVVGVWRTQRAFFDLLRARRGRTIVVSSEVARARFCHAFSGGYSMSKCCLDNFASVLRQEFACLQPPMPVTVLHLGQFNTPLLASASSRFALAAQGAPHSAFSPALIACDGLVRWYTRPAASAQHSAHFSPDRVAQKVLDVLEAGWPRERYALNVSWLMVLVSIIPSAILEFVIVAGIRAKLYGHWKALSELITSVLSAALMIL